jgi:RHS repeat-associated protein
MGGVETEGQAQGPGPRETGIMTTAKKTLLTLSILALLGLILGPGGGWRTLVSGDGADIAGGNMAADGAAPGLISEALAMGPPGGGGGANTAPVANAGFDQRVTVGATVVLNGTRSTDADGNEVTKAWSFVSVPAGSTATLSDATVIRPTFVADLAGDYTVQLIVDDGTVASAADTVTISTNNVAPVADAGIDREIAIGTTVELDGTASSDVDGNAITYSWTLTEVPAGSAAIPSDATSPRPTFFADLAGTYKAQLTVSDGSLSSDPVTVTYSTDNIPPVANAGPDKTKPTSTAIILDGVFSTDANGDLISYMWSVLSSPAPGSVALADEDLIRSGIAYAAAGDYVIQLIVDDGNGMSLPENVLITTGNTAPVADAGPDQSVIAGSGVTLDGGASSDDDGNALGYAWALISKPAGSSAALDDGTAVRPGFTADVAGTYIAQLMVDDGTTKSRPATVVVSTGNVAPVADAGPDQFRDDQPPVIQLDGSGSHDADNDPITYQWALISDPNRSTATLDNPNAVNASFNRDKAGTYVAQLIVGDGTSYSAPSNVFISSPKNGPITDDTNVRSVANAGPDQLVDAGALVQLDGSGSTDAQAEAITYRWALISKPPGSTATLSSTTAINPTFTADVSGTYVAQLIVSDPRVDSLPDTVVISPSNQPPVAIAGPDQMVFAAALVQLDGSASDDPDQDPITYAWSLTTVPAGSTAALSDSTIVNPTFTADLPGIYVAELIVDDGTVPSTSDSVTITATNTAPVANAGPDQQLLAGVTVQLDGSASSDAENHTLSFAWSLTTVPAGSTATLSNPGIANPTFVADLPGSYVAQLIVNDGFAPSTPDTVTITANTAPVADAGPDRQVIAGTIVQLDGSASSDAENQPLSYAWSLTTVPAGSTAVLSNAAIVNPTFVADLPGTYVAQLIVNDGFDPSAPDSATITAFPVGTNLAPVLDPIGNQTVALGSTLNLTLTASDPNNDPLAFSATPLPLPAGASLNGVTGVFTFQPDATQVGVINLTFTVGDGFLADSESISITVTGPTGTTALTGRLLDAIDQATPVVGASVSILNSGVAPVLTDATGNFTLSGIPSGEQIFDINSTAASPAPDGSDYAGFREAIDLIASVTNVVDRPFFLPRIDAASLTPVNAGAPAMVISAATGVTLDVAADTAMKDGVLFNCQTLPPDECELSISTVPPQFAPVALPEVLQPGTLISIQPVGVTFTQPAQITFPNTDNLEPLSEVDIYSLDPDTGTFVIVGTGQVSADGTVITTLTGGIVAATWHMTLPPKPGTNGSTNNPDNQGPGNGLEKDGPVDWTSSIAVSSGNLTEDHTLASYRSLSQSRALRFVYNSTSADPQPIVVTDTTIPLRSAVPDKISTRIRVAGVDQGAELFTSTSLPAPLDENIDETIHQAVQFDAGAFATGSYLYELMVTNHFGASAITGVQIDTLLVNNETASPFGAGWTLAGLQRLHIQADGAAVLTEGDGGIKRFVSAGNVGSGAFGPPANWGTIGNPLAHAVDDFNNDGWLDLAVPDQANNNVVVLLNDQTGNFPTSSIVDPGLGEFSGTIVVSTGSFNRLFDSHRDLAVSNWQKNKVTIHLGDGAGNFGSPVTTLDFIGAVPTSSGVADFDQDGNDDFIVGRPGSFDTAEVFWGDGTGAFPSSLGLTVPGEPISVVVGKFDGDTFPDIAIANHKCCELGKLNMHYSNGAPRTFQTVNFEDGDIRNNGNRWGAAAADFDGDGDLDVVIPNLNVAQVTVFYNDGGRTFAVPPATFPIAFEGLAVDTGDFNNDGFPDIVTVGLNDAMGNTSVSVLLNVDNGDGTRGFSAPTTFPVGTGAMWSVRVGDFDNDLILDLSVTSGAAAGIAILKGIAGSGGGEFTSPPGDFSTLMKNGDGTFTRTLKNDTRIEFDATGLQTAIIDRNGNTTSYDYDGQGRLITITDPKGLVTTLFYTGDHLSKVTDPAMRDTLFTVDANGDLTSITDPDLSVRQFTYDARHRVTFKKSKRGFDTEYLYNFAGRNVQANRADNTTRKISPSETIGVIDTTGSVGTEGNPAPYTRPGDVIASFTDGNDNTATFTLNRFGGTTSVLDALNRTLTIERDMNSNATRITQANGRVDQFTYDAKGNLLTRTEAVDDPQLERLITFTYEPTFDRVTSITDANGNPPTIISYDANGNPIEFVNAQGIRTTLAYGDANCPGLVTSITAAAMLPEENTTTFAYDPVTCNTVQLIDPLNNITAFTYDPAGNIIETTDAELRVTRVVYDAMNRLIKKIDATNSDPSPACGVAGVTCLGRDAVGNPTDLTDGNGGFTSFDYDTVERLISRTDSLTNAETFSYDNNSNLSFITDRKGQVIEFQYDAASRLIAKIMQPSTPEEVVRTVGYDAANNVTSVADPDSNLTFGYDLLNRRTSDATTGSPFQPDVSIQLTYDKNNNRLTMTDPVGQSTFVYDSLNRLTDLTAPGQQPITFTYDALSRLTGRALPNGTDATLAFDGASRLTSIAHALSATPISSFGYMHDKVGNRTEQNQQRTAVTVTAPQAYIYDALDQVTQATNPLPANPVETFTYDAVGNRLLRDGEVTNSIFDAANRLTEDETFLYIYDLNGNLETKTDKVTSAVTTYTYDAENRLVRIDFPDLTIAEYRYDGVGRRIEKNVASVITRYVYNKLDIVLEYDGTNVLTARYTHGPSIDEPLVMERDLDASGTFEATEAFFYHADGLGSVTELTDSAGVVVQAYVYDSYGQIVQQVGTLANPFTYTAREFDAESGLYFYRARYYDPEIGRFLTEDPLRFGAGDVNLYRYVFNGPITLTDPYGLLTKAERADIAKQFSNAVDTFGYATIAASITLPEGAPVVATLGAMTAASKVGEFYFSRDIGKVLTGVYIDIVTSFIPVVKNIPVGDVVGNVTGGAIDEMNRGNRDEPGTPSVPNEPGAGC